MQRTEHTLNGQRKESKMEDNNIIEYTKEQCLYALKRSIEECRMFNGVLIGKEVALGIYNYLSENEKLRITKNEEART